MSPRGAGKRDPDAPTWAPVIVQAIAVGLVVIALVALAVWFFFFAGSPLPSN